MDHIPSVTAEQMAEVDRIMIREIGVDVLQLMEVAGRAVAAFARDRMLGGSTRGKRVLILCGTGGNGGDGMVAARFLHAWGAAVDVWVSQRPDPNRGVAAHQLAILERMALPIVDASTADADPLLPDADLVIDALLGFSLSGPPAGTTAALIRAANAHPAPVLAVDLPSGLTATAGLPLEPCIHATATLTLALPKTRLLTDDARRVTGELSLADIGVPPEVFRRFGIDIGPLFGEDDVLRVPF
jgi:NAD(P)H-hydrate epimerase